MGGPKAHTAERPDAWCGGQAFRPSAEGLYPWAFGPSAQWPNALPEGLWALQGPKGLKVIP